MRLQRFDECTRKGGYYISKPYANLQPSQTGRHHQLLLSTFESPFHSLNDAPFPDLVDIVPSKGERSMWKSFHSLKTFRTRFRSRCFPASITLIVVHCYIYPHSSLITLFPPTLQIYALSPIFHHTLSMPSSERNSKVSLFGRQISRQFLQVHRYSTLSSTSRYTSTILPSRHPFFVFLVLAPHLWVWM